MPFLGFNPFNPFSYWAAAMSRPVYPRQARLSDSTPIAIKPRSSDPGMKLTAGDNSVSIKGTATQGAKVVRDLSGYVDYELARGMSFTLDIDDAPTVDVFGKSNFTEKNSRIFTLDTSPGWSAEKCARMLADKVNKGDDFRATVSVAASGQSATIDFERR